MSPTERLSLATKKVHDIVRDTRSAIALNEMWQRCASAEDLTKKFNQSVEAWGFNSVRDSTHIALIMALMRLHDAEKVDRSSISSVIKILRNGEVRGLLAERLATQARSMNITYVGDEQYREIAETGREQWAREDIDRFSAELDAAIHTADSLKRDEIVAKLTALRNTVLAHSSTATVQHGARYGDERVVLEQTIPVAKHLSLAVLGGDPNFVGYKQIWKKTQTPFGAILLSPNERQSTDFNFGIYWEP